MTEKEGRSLIFQTHRPSPYRTADCKSVSVPLFPTAITVKKHQ